MDNETSKSPTSILLVDDDRYFVNLLRNNLESEGYRVFSGSDGGMAVQLARKHHPNVILMDVNMPYVNGIQAFKRLRASPDTAAIPVVFLSEMMSQVIYPTVQAAPRAAYLKKPIDISDLKSILRQFIELYTQ